MISSSKIMMMTTKSSLTKNPTTKNYPPKTMNSFRKTKEKRKVDSKKYRRSKMMILMKNHRNSITRMRKSKLNKLSNSFLNLRTARRSFSLKLMNLLLRRTFQREWIWEIRISIVQMRKLMKFLTNRLDGLMRDWEVKIRLGQSKIWKIIRAETYLIA